MAGGSADAAGALVACAALWGTGLGRAELAILAARVGSDVPFALMGGTALGTGRGERITPAMVGGVFHWVLAISDQGLATPAVYAKLDQLRSNRSIPAPGVAPDVLAALRAADAEALGRLLDNDLQEAACALAPELTAELDALFRLAGSSLAEAVDKRDPFTSESSSHVSVWERTFGSASFVKQADLKTGTSGAYDFTDTPQLLSDYQVRWGNRLSAVVTVGVRPRMTFIRRAPWFVTSAKVGRPLAGRWVYVQRRSSLGQWVNRKKVRLGSSGARRFKMDLPRGRHILRMFMTTNQAGTGYLWSHSRTLVVTKR
jgi:hypothetical protein